MLMQISLLGKRLMASRHRANVRPLARVHSKVVKEVVPLSKDEVTFFEVTFQDFDLSVSLRILKLENAIAFGFGHLACQYFNFIEVHT